MLFVHLKAYGITLVSAETEHDNKFISFYFYTSEL